MPESAFSDTNWSLAAGSGQAILDKLRTKSIPLGEYVGGKIQYGIKTGFNEAFVIDKVTRERLITEDPKSAEVIKPFVSGEDVRKYGIDFQERYLIWTYVGIPINQYPAIYKHLHQYRLQLEKRSDKGNYWWELRPCSYYTDFEKPKIMYPEIFMDGRFTADNEGYYCNKTIFIIPITNMYLLSILNSRMMDFNYGLILPKIRGGFFIPGYVFMKDVPIRRINFTTSPQERANYLEKARNLYAYCLDKNDQDCVLGFVDHHLSQVPEESDVVHDLLAFLAEEMVRLNKEKRAAQREFLDWLVTTLKLLPDKEGRRGIDVLTGKAKLADYPGDYQKGEPPLATDELLDILRKNKGHLGVSLSDVGLLERVRVVYEESLLRVLPIKERLARTDRLIDEVVYRLYGLTEEEIGVVEGRG